MWALSYVPQWHPIHCDMHYSCVQKYMKINSRYSLSPRRSVLSAKHQGVSVLPAPSQLKWSLRGSRYGDISTLKFDSTFALWLEQNPYIDKIIIKLHAFFVIVCGCTQLQNPQGFSVYSGGWTHQRHHDSQEPMFPVYSSIIYHRICPQGHS